MNAPTRSLESATLAGDERTGTPIGDIALRHSYFDDDASRRLFDEMDYQRACQAYVWSHPIVSMTTWRLRQGAAHGVKGPTDFVVLNSLKEKRGVVTANLSTPYILQFASLKDGPLVVEYPGGMTAGAFIDLWQRPVADTGLTGPDGGKGGTYVVVGPEGDPKAYEKPGTFVFQSATNVILFGVRILDPDPAFYQRFKSSLLMGRHGAPLARCPFIENRDVEWSATAPRGLEYWRVLSEAIRDEPVRAVDKAWMAILLPLGIEKGKPFQPDARQQSILLKGAAMGELMARNLQVNPRFAEPYWKDTHWYKCFDFTIPQETETRVELDERTTWFYEAVTSSEGMVNPVVGKGQVYMTTKRDATGTLFRADKTYVLRVPKDVPVAQFWALTLYSENTRRPYDNGGADARSVNLGSKLEDQERNADGSVDLFVGAKAPAGFERNFMSRPSSTRPSACPISRLSTEVPRARSAGDRQPSRPRNRPSRPNHTESTMKTTQTESIRHQGKIAALPFVENRAMADTAQTLRDELLYHRATQTYLWALPLINTLGMKVGSEKAFGEGYDVLPVWKKRLDARTLVTTPNSDVIYAMSYVDLGKDGPLVFEAPPMLQGILLDFWQRPIPVDGGKYAGDVGFFGPDQGKGGKFLLLPPGYQGEVPEGCFVCRSGTNNVFVFLRAFYADAGNLQPPVDLIEKTKIYPLEGAARPMKFPDASGVPANMLPFSDATAFDQLKKLVDAEGPHLADPDWMGMLAGLGIVKGEPFQPDERTRGILDRGARSGYTMSRVLAFDEAVSGRSFRMYPDRRWVNPMADATTEKPSGKLDLSWRRVDRGGALDVDCRPWFFSNYYSVSPGMLSQIPGKGAFYVIAFTDSNGVALTGGTNYTLNLPKDVPAANFWSVTLYEAENASGLANGQPFPSLGSRDEPVRNADGGTDLYLGPEAPEGKEMNWLATVPGKGYFAILRLYGPTEPALGKTWKPGDLTKMK